MLVSVTIHKILSNIVIPPKNSLNIYNDIHIYNIYVNSQTITKICREGTVNLSVIFAPIHVALTLDILYVFPENFLFSVKFKAKNFAIWKYAP